MDRIDHDGSFLPFAAAPLYAEPACQQGASAVARVTRPCPSPSTSLCPESVGAFGCFSCPLSNPSSVGWLRQVSSGGCGLSPAQDFRGSRRSGLRRLSA